MRNMFPLLKKIKNINDFKRKALTRNFYHTNKQELKIYAGCDFIFRSGETKRCFSGRPIAGNFMEVCQQHHPRTGNREMLKW